MLIAYFTLNSWINALLELHESGMLRNECFLHRHDCLKTIDTQLNVSMNVIEHHLGRHSGHRTS